MIFWQWWYFSCSNFCPKQRFRYPKTAFKICCYLTTLFQYTQVKLWMCFFVIYYFRNSMDEERFLNHTFLLSQHCTIDKLRPINPIWHRPQTTYYKNYPAQGSSWALLNYTLYLMQATCVQIYAKQYFYFRSPSSPWPGPQWNSIFRVFFSAWSIYFHHVKNKKIMPYSTFSDHRAWLHICLLTKLGNLLVQNLGHNHLKNAEFLVWEVYVRENECLLLPILCTFQNPTDPVNLKCIVYHWWYKFERHRKSIAANGWSNQKP